MDVGGHGGGGDVTGSGLLGNDDIAMDVLAVADHLGIRRFAVLGVSFGGAVGIEAAVASPEPVAALVPCEAIAIEAGSREEQHFGAVGVDHPLAIGARRRRDRKSHLLNPSPVLPPSAFFSLTKQHNHLH